MASQPPAAAAAAPPPPPPPSPPPPPAPPPPPLPSYSPPLIRPASPPPVPLPFHPPLRPPGRSGNLDASAASPPRKAEKPLAQVQSRPSASPRVKPAPPRERTALPLRTVRPALAAPEHGSHASEAFLKGFANSYMNSQFPSCITHSPRPAMPDGLQPVFQGLARQHFKRVYALRSPRADTPGPNLQAPLRAPVKPFGGAKSPRVLRQISHLHKVSVDAQAHKQEILSDTHQPNPQWLPPEVLVVPSFPDAPVEATPSIQAYSVKPRPATQGMMPVATLYISANISFRSLRTSPKPLWTSPRGDWSRSRRWEAKHERLCHGCA